MRLHVQYIATNLLTFLAGYFICTLVNKNNNNNNNNNNKNNNDNNNNEEIVPKDQIDHDEYAKHKLNKTMATDVKLFSEHVTVITFCENKHAFESLNEFIKLYPNTTVLTASPRNTDRTNVSPMVKHVGEFSVRAEALNKLIGEVKTKYWLHLDTYHHVELATSDQGVGWLLQSLEKIKSLDIVGGSVHVEKALKEKYDTLEVPCYRLHHYNYTYSETYEYKQSILDIMVCERTSTSFLANTDTYRKTGLSFDVNIGDKMLFEDFFLQAKKRGVVMGTKPEVYFLVRSADNKQRSAVQQHVTTALVPDLMQFGLKHHVMVISDIDGQILYICERFSTIGTNLFAHEQLLCDYDRARPYWKMEHWAYAGMCVFAMFYIISVIWR